MVNDWAGTAILIGLARYFVAQCSDTRLHRTSDPCSACGPLRQLLKQIDEESAIEAGRCPPF